jgi:hypothetical protein
MIKKAMNESVSWRHEIFDIVNTDLKYVGLILCEDSKEFAVGIGSLDGPVMT